MPATKINAKTKAKPKSAAQQKKASAHKPSKAVKKAPSKKTVSIKLPKKKKKLSLIKKTALSTAHKKTKAATKRKIKNKSTSHFEESQKEQLLFLIKEIVGLHKMDKGGLKSLFLVERILDRYNQQYKNTVDKFDAIVKFAMSKDPEMINKHFYIAVQEREESVDNLYKLLALIGKGKIAFEDAKEKMLYIYEEMPAAKYGKGLNVELTSNGGRGK